MDIFVAGRKMEFSRGQLFMMLIALLMIGYAGYDYVQQINAIQTAVAVNATITEVGITLSNGGGMVYFPEVTYEYQFEGGNYTGDAVFPGSLSSAYERSEARAILAPYAENETVTAYVNPHSPTDVFLKKKTGSGHLPLAGFGVLMFVTMLFQGRQSAIDGSQTHSQQQSEHDGEGDNLTILGFDHDRLGTVCKRFIIGSVVATWVSVVSIVFVVLAIDSSTQTSPVQVDLFSPAGIVFLAAFLSGIALIVSILTYSGWSYLESRWLRTTLQFERHRGRIGLLFADDENLNRYERRVRLTEFSLLIALFFLIVLLDILNIVDIPP
jgi:hypothetical protein